MSIERLNGFRYPVAQQSVFDKEELTALQLAARTAKKVNECVDAVNQFDIENISNVVIPSQITAKFAAMIADGSFSDYLNASLLEDLNNIRVSVDAYGAKGDGTTDDTAAINLALDYCNTNNKTLCFTAGKHYMVSPGGLHDVKCSIDGTDSTIQLNSLADAAVFNIDYDEAEGHAFRNFKFCNILGYNDYCGTGYGIFIWVSDYSKFEIQNLRNFHQGITLDGAYTNRHIGVNDFYVNLIGQCRTAIYLSGESESLKCESNRFYVNYSVNNTEFCVHIAGATASLVYGNYFEFMFLENTKLNAVGVYIEASGVMNRFKFNASLTNIGTITGAVLVCQGAYNEFIVPTDIRNDTAGMIIYPLNNKINIPVAFHAHMNGTNQTLASGDNVAVISTASINKGNSFANSAFTPCRQGRYKLYAKMKTVASNNGQTFVVGILKNDVAIAWGKTVFGTGSAIEGEVTAIVEANGDLTGTPDVFKVAIYQDGGAQVISGNVLYTFFEGAIIE